MNRVCCGAVHSFRGDYPLKMVVITVRTTTFVSRIWNKGYHGSAGASRWFCKIYRDKVVIVGLFESRNTEAEHLFLIKMNTQERKKALELTSHAGSSIMKVYI